MFSMTAPGSKIHRCRNPLFLISSSKELKRCWPTTKNTLNTDRENLSPCRYFILLLSGLLQLDFSASFFQLLLGVFRISFAYCFLDGRRSAVNQVFGFFQAQTGDGTNDLDHVHFLV